MDSSISQEKTTLGQRKWKMRNTIDIVARRVVEFGGISVIAAIALIFLFLLSVVYPLFGQPSIQEIGQYQTPGNDQPTSSH